MEDDIRDVGVLDVIRILGSQRETGKLQVTTGMTEGAFFFDKGTLVEARLGKLTGFQAINALASIPDATYSFDPAIAPPAQSSIPANERRLLKDFFGIDVFDREQVQDAEVTWPDEDDASRVVPLTDIEEDDERLLADREDETTLVKTDAPREEQRPAERTSKRKFPPPVLFTILIFLIAAGAVFLVYRLRNTGSTPSTVQTSSPDDVAAATDLTGNWNVVNTVEQTSYQAYKNLQVGFNLAIDQTGKDFTGKGEKVSENGRSLPRNSRTPILVKGSIDGDRVEATFSERGAVRKTSGRFVWKIDKASGGLTGTFVSTAARASGRSAATKQL